MLLALTKLVISNDYINYSKTEVEPSEPVIAIFCYESVE